MRRTIAIFMLIICISCNASTFNKKTHYDVCFTPGDNCDVIIANTINHAESLILIQAYHLTNKKIIEAILDKNKSGVTINILLDKTALKEATIFKENGINVLIDHKPRIAHNKVIIIDGKTVVTGSFNFTESAQHSNAENVIIIDNKALAKKYTANYKSRYKESSQIK